MIVVSWMVHFNLKKNSPMFRIVFNLLLFSTLFVFVQSCDEEEDVDIVDCEVKLAVRENSCSSFTFNNVDQLVMDWEVNGVIIESSTQFSFNASAASTYEICGIFDKEGCPLESRACETIEVSLECLPNNNACAVELTQQEETCSVRIFGNSLEAVMDWTVNGELMTTAEGFNFEAQEAGIFEICGFLETPECPQGMQTCQSVEIASSCFTSPSCEIELTQQEETCSVRIFGNSMQAVMDWTVNGNLMTTATTFDFEAEAAGTYEICGFFETPDCPQGAQTCQTVEIASDCFANPSCEIELIQQEETCSLRIFSNDQQVVMDWTVNGNLMTTATTFDFEAAAAGTYEICGFFETPDCQQGAQTCQTVEISSDCF